jgi:hypothetical protein
MKYAIFLMFCLSLLVGSCGNKCDFEKCPYGGLYELRVPVTIVPHKVQYQVGDTIHINTIFPDSFYYTNTQQKYRLRDFPFKPVSLLYRITSDSTYDSGYRVNELYIDSSYHHVYNYSSSYADGYRAYTIYENSSYRFESRLVLKQPGKYMLVFGDVYANHVGTGNSELNAKADSIIPDGQCTCITYGVYGVIQGDDQLNLFEKELVFLDNEVYRGELKHLGNFTGPLGNGGIVVELNGFFGFEVVE